MGSRQSTRVAWLSGALALVAILVFPSLGAQQQLVRGNAPGEWRYWGADAWSTRYSPLDQINATNFDNLQVAWQWNAAVDGADEYYRTTPLYANGRLFTVATTRRYAYAIDPATGKTLWMWRLEEGIRWQKAPRQFAGRGLAYWTDGRGNERVVVVTPGYHMASSTRRPASPIRTFGKNGVVDLHGRPGLPIVPLAVDDTGPLDHQRHAAGAQGASRARRGTRRRRSAPTARSASIRRTDRSPRAPRPIIVGDVIIVGSSSIHGYYPTRLRNLPGYIRGFDIKTGKQLWKFNLVPQPGEFGAETWKNGSKIGHRRRRQERRVGAVLRRSGSRPRLHPGRHAAQRRIRRPSPRRQPLRQQPRRARREDRQRKWHFQMVHHDIWDYDTPMAPNLMDVTRQRPRRKVIAQTTKQGWIYTFDRVTGEPIWPMPETPVLQSEVPGEETVADAADSVEAGAVRAAGTRRRRSDRLHAGDQGGRAQAGEAVPHGPVLHSAVADRRHDASITARGTRRAQRRREHRRRRGGRSGDRHDVRRRRRPA